MRFSEQIADIFIMHVDTFGNFYVSSFCLTPALSNWLNHFRILCCSCCCCFFFSSVNF